MKKISVAILILILLLAVNIILFLKNKNNSTQFLKPRVDGHQAAAGCILFTFDEPFSSFNDPVFALIKERVFLINRKGELVKSWKSDVPITKAILTHDGEVWALGGIPWDEVSDPKLIRFTWDGEVKVSQNISGAHHDFSFINKHLVLLPAQRNVESKYLPSTYSHHSIWLSDDIIEYDLQTEKVVKRIELHKLFPMDTADVAEKDNRKIFHINSVTFLKTNPINQREAYLVSAKNLSRIGIIDRESGELLYLSKKDELSQQHSASLLNSGQILVFNNGLDQAASQIVELDPVGKMPKWEWKTPYQFDFFSRAEGSVQRLANGNTLIANSMAGYIFEINGAGDLVFEYLGKNMPPITKYFWPFSPIYHAQKYDEKAVPFAKLKVNCL